MMKISSILITLFCLFVFLQPAHAQTGGSYELTWSTVDSGGSEASGGDFVLNGTIGQPDAAVTSGGSFQLSGGFWQAHNTTPTAVTLGTQPGATSVTTPLILLGLFSLLLAFVTFRLNSTKRIQSTPGV